MTKKQRKTPQERTDYEIGKGRPPKHTQFKPGESGNPTGKPKGSKNKPKGADATLRKIILNEAKAPVHLSVNGTRETVPMIQGIVKQNNAKALKGNTAATRLSVTLAHQAAKEEHEVESLEADETMEQALLAQSVKRYWTNHVNERRRRGMPLEFPIPHPDHITINPQTCEVSIKAMTAESVNAMIDLIGKLAEMEAMSLATGSINGLWTTRAISKLPCEHIQAMDVDFSIPDAPARLDKDDAAAHVFSLMVNRTLPTCEHKECLYRNACAEEYMFNYAAYTMGRMVVPRDDPLWREYGPKLVDAYLDRDFFYGPEPDPDQYKVYGASLPDPRFKKELECSRPGNEKTEFQETMRDWLQDEMGEDWHRRFDDEFLTYRDVDGDYLAYCKFKSDDPEYALTDEFIDSIEWPGFLHRYRREDLGDWSADVR